MGVSKPAIPITGVWLLRRGTDVVVLVEHDGKWKRVIVEYFEGPFSHIAEQAGIINSPVDEING